MDEPTALLPPVSTSTLRELLARGPLPLPRGLELMSVVAEQLARLHDKKRTHGLLTADSVRVQLFESGPPVVTFTDVEAEATRETTEGADLLALGVLAFQVLVGRTPEPHEALATALTDAPSAVDKLVGRLLAPRAADRVAAAAAQRQFLDLSAVAASPLARAAPPLERPPLIKRGVPIGLQSTAGHAWVNKAPPAPSGEPAVDPQDITTGENERDNPFADDEKTARVEPSGPGPAPEPPIEDEPTQYEPRPPVRKRPPPERPHPPPPVPTPAPSQAPHRAEAGHEQFEPTSSDLPQEPVEPTTDPRPLVRRRRARQSPRTQAMRLMKEQPAWVWVGVGVVVAFFVLLLVALAR